MFPIDAITKRAIRATSGDSSLIPSSATPFTILYTRMDKTSEAQQLIQCKKDTTYTTLIQAISSNPQEVFGQWIFPEGTECYLRTYDSILTGGYITYVPRDISIIQTGSSATQTVEFGPLTSEGIYGLAFMFYAFMTIILLYIGIKLGLFFFKK